MQALAKWERVGERDSGADVYGLGLPADLEPWKLWSTDAPQKELTKLDSL